MQVGLKAEAAAGEAVRVVAPRDLRAAVGSLQSAPVAAVAAETAMETAGREVAAAGTVATKEGDAGEVKVVAVTEAVAGSRL